MKINFSHSRSKVKTLADTISHSIMEGSLGIGHNLLSINDASAKYRVSRDTVFKAYKELKKRDLIDSNPTKGYYVTGEVNHILLLLDNYSSFKQNLYRRFMSNLPKNSKVDLIFHQYNENLFETIIRESLGKYSMYVVMNFENNKISSTLKAIPASKLLLLDFGNFDKTPYSYICQDFEESLLQCLNKSNELLHKYKKLSFVFPVEICHPLSSIDYFVKYCEEQKMDYEIIRDDIDKHSIEKGVVYICILQEDLVKIIKRADKNGLVIAQDIGLIAYNDEPILEIIKNGISTISIDFGLMGEKAAQFITQKKVIKEYIPTEMILRGSL